jgi:hypothetical protein
MGDVARRGTASECGFVGTIDLRIISMQEEQYSYSSCNTMCRYRAVT